MTSSAYTDLLKLNSQVNFALKDRDYINRVVVVKALIPGGWTRMYRSDGQMVIFIDRPTYFMLDPQRYCGVPIYDRTQILGRMATGIPVYRED